MHIDKLVLGKYKRLMLSNIDHFEWTPGGKMMLILGSNGAGKAQPLSSWIKTPGGWSTMGEMKVGTEVVAKDGTTTKVTHVFPQGKKQIYKITFEDGRSTRATGDHLWSVYTGGKKYPIVPEVLTTEQIMEALKGCYSHLLWVDLIDKEQDKDIDLPIDPYVMGVLLGDGCLDGIPVVTNPDEFILDKVTQRLGTGLVTKVRGGVNERCLTWSIIADKETAPKGYNNLPRNKLVDQLTEFGLRYKRSWEKFVPEMYLMASSKQRLELVQGLMDTDGYIDTQSSVSYCSSSEDLANHMVYLIRSLGGHAKIRPKIPYFRDTKGNRVRGRPTYIVSIRYKKPSELFTLPKKKERANDDGQYCKILKLRIKTIEPDGIEEAQCIRIDHPDKLYITDNFIVTHNSSILDELTPVPAHHSAFEKGGYKEFHCTHKGHSYILISKYEKGSGEHSLIKDLDEELNPGGTFAVQRQLVWDIFGLDRNTHEVLTGVQTFTSMPTAKRREWLTRLSPVDLSFAFKQYQTIATHKRDAQAVIKHKAKRMSTENLELPSDAELQEYRNKVTALNNQLQGLYRQRGSKPITPVSIRDFEGHYEQLKGRIKQQLQAQPFSEAFIGVKNQSELLSRASVTEHQLTQINTSLEDTGNQLEAIKKQQGSLEDYGTPEQIQALNQELDSLKATVATHQAKLSTYQGILPIVQHDVYQHSQGLLEELLHTWNELIVTTPDNPEGRFSHQKGKEAREQFASNKQKLMGLNEKHTTSAQRLARLRGCDDIQCPQCDHSFKPGIDPKEIAFLEKECERYHAIITEGEKRQEELKEYIEAFDDYMTYISRFRALVRQYELYKPVWDIVVEQRMMFTTPRKFHTDVIKWGEAQKLSIALTGALQRIKEIQAQLDRYSSFDKDQATYLKDQQSLLETRMENLYNERIALQRSQQGFKQGIQAVTQYTRTLETLEGELVDYLDQVERQIVNLVNQGFDEQIKRTSLELSELQAQLHRHELMEHTLKDIEREHQESIAWFNDLGILEKAMSPKDGLIGKYLMGFMQQLVKLMNAIIEEVWTYPLEVMPSKIDKDELDYNFPLNVNNGAVMPPDISRGSSSQRDIVNFAFKIIVMKFLGFDDYPLYLDEFGNTFDEQHRENLIPFLNRLLEMNQISQIVYISHFVSTHGAFNHAEVVVLDPTNITTPAVYNTNVKFAA